jgi:competence protein ComEC
VVGLVAFYEASHGRLNAWRADRGWAAGAAIYVGGLVLTSLVATLATTPYAVYHFNRFAAWGIASNFLAVPLTGFWVMPAAMLGCLLMPFGLESWGLVPMGWGIDALNWVARAVAAWPGAVIGIPAMPLGGIVAVTAGGLWLAIWRGKWRYWGLVPILLGCATVLFGRAPDVILSGDGRVIAVRANDGDYMLSAKANRITEETWLRRAGAGKGPAWPELGTSADGRLACDALGCIYKVGGRTVALAKDAAALGEDCRRADLVVAQVPARRLCGRRAVIIDRIDAWRLGAHAIWLDPDRIRIEAVDTARGERPWVPRRRASSGE